MTETARSGKNESPIGVLLVNLGTPKAPTTSAVRRYLREFLSDRRVIDTPKIIWWFILNGVILLIRPSKVAKLYQSVWTDQGSPLLAISRRQAQALAVKLEEKYPDSYRVELAMTYGTPSIPDALKSIQEQGCQRVVVLPLYPQYSATTTAAVFDRWATALRDVVDIPETRFIKKFHAHPAYIAALAVSVSAHWQEQGKPDRLLMSFHGIPERYVANGDPYVAQCQATARALAQALQLEDKAWKMSFQSRFGPAAWVQPYTDEVLKQWAGEQLKRIDVVCPAFAADCLETLEEISVQNRELYQHAGGGEYLYIPALNDRPEFIDCLVELVELHGR